MFNQQNPLARLTVALALLVSGLPSHAANSLSVAVDACSGTRQNTETESYQIDCSDNFTLSNGTITSDVKVVIVGVSSLTITNVKITAPAVEFKSDGSLSLGSGTEIATDSAQIGSVSGQAAPSFYASNDATISLSGAPAAQVVASSGALVGVVSPALPAASGIGVSADDEATQNSGGGGVGFGMLVVLLLAVVATGLSTRVRDTRAASQEASSRSSRNGRVVRAWIRR